MTVQNLKKFTEYRRNKIFQDVLAYYKREDSLKYVYCWPIASLNKLAISIINIKKCNREKNSKIMQIPHLASYLKLGKFGTWLSV